MNKCIFSGRIAKTGELITTQSGVEMLKFSLAVRDKRKGEDYVTVFPEFIAFGNTAKLSLAKGTLIEIVSKFSTNNYTSASGESRQNKYFVVEDIRFLESKKDSYTGNSNNSNSNRSDDGLAEMSEDEIPDDIPF